MKEEPLCTLLLLVELADRESLVPHKLGVTGHLPSPGQALPGYGGDRQPPFYKVLRDLTNESTK